MPSQLFQSHFTYALRIFIIESERNLWQKELCGNIRRFLKHSSGTLLDDLVVLFIPSDLFVHDWEGESAPYEWKAENNCCCRCLLNAYWAPGSVLGVSHIGTQLDPPNNLMRSFLLVVLICQIRETQALEVTIPSRDL